MTFDQVVTEQLRAVVREEIRAALAEHRGGASSEVLDYSQAAELVGYHVSTITKWVHNGLLPAHGRGKGKRVYRADVLKALELSTRAKVAPTAMEIADDILNRRKVRSIR